jgi:hypothetical protein
MKGKYRKIVILVILLSTLLVSESITLFSNFSNNSIIEPPLDRQKIKTSGNNYYFLDGITQIGYSFDAKHECYILTELSGTDFTTFELDSQIYDVNYGLNIIPIDFGNSSTLHSLTFEQDDIDDQNFEWFAIQPLILEENETVVSLDDTFSMSFFAAGTVAILVQPSFSYNWLYLELDGNVINDIYDPNYYPEIDSTLFSYFVEEGSYLSFIFDLEPQEHTLNVKGNGSLNYKIITNFDWDGDLISDVEEIQKELFYETLDPTIPNVWGYFEKSEKITQFGNISGLGSGYFYFYIPDLYVGSKYLYIYSKRGTISEIVIDDDYITLDGITLSQRDKTTPYGYLNKGHHSVSYCYNLNETTEILVQIDGRDALVLERMEFKDTDGDGVKDIQERNIGTDKNLIDTDFDGILDNLDSSPLTSLTLKKDEYHTFDIPANIDKNTVITMRIQKPDPDYTTHEKRIYLDGHSHGPGINVTIFPIMDVSGNTTGVEDPVPDLEKLNASSIYSYAQLTEEAFEFKLTYGKGHPAKNDGEIQLKIHFRWMVLHNNSGITIPIRTYDFEQDILVQSMSVAEVGDANYILGTPDSMIENQILWAMAQNPMLGTPADYDVDDDVIGMGSLDYLEIANQTCVDYDNAQLNENETVVLYVAGEQKNYDLLNKISLQSIINPSFEVNHSGQFTSYSTFCAINEPSKNSSTFNNFLSKSCYEIGWKNLSTEFSHHYEQRANIQAFPIKMETFLLHNSRVLKMTQAVGNGVPLNEIPYTLEPNIYDKIAILNQTFLEPIGVNPSSSHLFFNKSTHTFYENLDTHQMEVEASELIFEAEDIPFSERFVTFMDQLKIASQELNNVINSYPELGIELNFQNLWDEEVSLQVRLIEIDFYTEILYTGFTQENFDILGLIGDLIDIYGVITDLEDLVEGVENLCELFEISDPLKTVGTTTFEFSVWFQRKELITGSISIILGVIDLLEGIYKIYSLLSNDANYTEAAFALKMTIAIGETILAAISISSGTIQIVMTFGTYAFSQSLVTLSSVLPIVGAILMHLVKFVETLARLNKAWEDGGDAAMIAEFQIIMIELLFPIFNLNLIKTLMDTGKLELLCWIFITPLLAGFIISLFLEQPAARQIEIVPSYEVIWEDAEGHPLTFINFIPKSLWVGNSLTLGDLLDFQITFLNDGNASLWLRSYIGIPEADGTLDYGLPYFTTWVYPNEIDEIHQYKGLGVTSPNLKIMWKLEIFTMIGPDMVKVYDNETEIIINQAVCPKHIIDFFSLTEEIAKVSNSEQHPQISVKDHALIELDPTAGDVPVNLSLDIEGFVNSPVTFNITCDNANFYVDTPTIIQNLYTDINFNLYSQDFNYLGGIYYFTIEVINGTGFTIFTEEVPFRLSFLRDLTYSQTNVIYEEEINKIFYQNNISTSVNVPTTMVGVGDVLFLKYLTNSSKKINISLFLDAQYMNTYLVKSRGSLDDPQQFVEILIDKDFTFNKFYIEGDLSSEDYLWLKDLTMVDGSPHPPSDSYFNPFNFTNNGNVPEFVIFSFSGVPFEDVDTTLYQSEFAGKHQYGLITEGEERVCLFNISNPIKAISNLYYRSITARDPISSNILCKYYDNLEIEGIYINNPLNTTHYIYIRDDTLLISIIPQEDLVWSSYSLDDQSLVNFSHSVYIPIPQEGLHKIQIFGENSLSESFESDIRYFTTKSMLIDIKNPLSELYSEPDKGYIYNASYGFDYDLNGSKPTSFDSSENVHVNNYIDNHIKVVELKNKNEHITYTNEIPRAIGTVELWIRFGDLDHNSYSINFRDSLTNDYLFRISAYHDTWHYNPDYQTTLSIPNVADPQSNTWYHVKIDFRCNGAPSYLGLPEEYFAITINGASSGPLDFCYTGLNECGSIKIRTGYDNSVYEKLWVDAIGLSWDPDYAIGDNLGGMERYALPLNYDSDVYLKSINYSIDSSNTTPLLTRDLALFSVSGTQTYELYGIDLFGDPYESNLLNLAINNVNLITPSGTNILINDPFTGVSLNFTNIVTSGNTIISLLTNETIPAFPSTFLGYPTYILSTHFYEITSSAEFYDPVTITFPYPETHIQKNERNIELFRYRNGGWRNITHHLNLDQNEISGIISSLSYFVVAEIIDDVAPSTEILINGSPPRQDNYYSHDLFIELKVYEYFRVVETLYSLDGINWISYKEPFVLNEEIICHFEYFSIDDSNNSETIKWRGILLDKSPPITEIIIDPIKTDSSGIIYYLEESTISFIVNDTSPYYATYFRIENTHYNDWESYQDPIDLPDSGTLTIYFYSVDVTGHIEEIQSITISRYFPILEFLPIIIGSSIAGLAGVAVLLTVLLKRKRKRNALLNP